MSTSTSNIMNGVSRFLSRREKHHEKRLSKQGRPSKVLPPFFSSPSLLQDILDSVGFPSFWRKPAVPDTSITTVQAPSDSSNNDIVQAQPVPANLYTIFSNQDARLAKDDEKKKVQTLLQRLKAAGITRLEEPQVEYALARNPNDLDRAYELLLLANDSFEGIIKDYDDNVHMLGAVNRNMVTCYLDALLFAMFARLDSFEAMLFDNFSDEPRKKLAAVLRLWVNLLRVGELISVDLTKHLQDALGRCGWEEATQICQQDASEAFTFITGALELPLLTLKMDIYHTGREDKEDDHKFVNERLLEVAIPEPEDGSDVTLEDCLETYFNNRIEVKRYLQRQNTISSVRAVDRDPEKSQAIHVETIELSSPSTPIVATPTSMTPSSPLLPARPLTGRKRGDSIFNERYTVRATSSEKKPFDEKRILDEMLNDGSGRPRSASIRKEVMMPAWQFFSLIPWYTDNVPKSDSQVAAHFSAKRPILGICLKRYTMLPNGSPKRLDTYIDIPLEIGLPHFVSDDRMEEEGPLFGNFKLVLQSVVCHRGISVDSGHYVALVRANKHPHHQRPGSSSSQVEENPDSWLRFDDLASERVTKVDMKKALREESPYLLFYQVQPINEELATRGDPPSYTESQSVLPSVDPSRETLASTDNETGEWDKVSSADLSQQDSGKTDEPGRSSISSNRRSFSIEELEGSVQSLHRGRTAPTTPDEGRSGFLSSTPSRRNSKAWLSSTNKSRPSSQSGEGRLSLTISRLTGRGSKDKLQTAETGNPDDPVIVINEVQTRESGSEAQNSVISTATITPNKPQGLKAGNAGGLGRSKSKKDKKEEKKRLRSKSRDPADLVDHKGKHKAKDRPDRECIVM